MTAKEKLLREARRWSEHEAEVALRAVEREVDPVIRRLDEAPLEDEEISPEEEEEEAAVVVVAEGRADIAAGRTVSLEEAMRELEPSSPRQDLRGSVKVLVSSEEFVNPIDIAWDMDAERHSDG